jgi:threonine aldolase
VKQKIDVREIAKYYDSVTVCLSKGLAAPVGSMLCGTASFIKESRRWRKVLGGGMRQAGVLAAAGIVALTEMVERLEEDHENARRLGEGLMEIPGFRLEPSSVQTNMVFFEMDERLRGVFIPFMAERGILIGTGHYPIRLVTHYGIEAADIEYVLCAARDCSERFLVK